MFVGFLGAPISGKTTVAARLFAALKDNGYVAEFVPEQARVYIARRRAETQGPITLTDSDQRRIFEQQADLEALFSAASLKRGFVVTDSASILACLYMSAEGRVAWTERAAEAAQRFDILFRCHPVRPGETYDPNRVHNFEQSQVLDSQLPALISQVKPRAPIIDLVGTSDQRARFAYSELMERFIWQQR